MLDLSPSLLYPVAFSACILCALLYFEERRRSHPPFPPGPKPLPIIGNLRDLPRKKEGMIYHEWAKRYGDIFHVEVLGRRMIFLNTPKAANDLFNKQSSNYSDRNHLHMINDLMGWDWSFGMMEYGDRWKKHRVMFDRKFRASQAPAFWPIQKQRAQGLLKDLLESPERFMDHLRHAAASTIMKITYGIDVSKHEDQYIAVAEEALLAMAKAASPGAFLVDLIPILKYVPAWFPGAGFQRKAREWKKTTLKMRDAPFEHVKTAMAHGNASPSFVSELINEVETSKSNLNEQKREIATVRDCAGLAYAESIVSALSSFLLAMSLYPEVQQKAQSYLDAVCPDRLPDFSDRPSLPYIDAICKEVLRWGPEAPLGLPHMATKDGIYEGYYIPAGASIDLEVAEYSTTRAILHDEVVYPEPMKFKPERWLPTDGRPVPPDPDIAAFGYGRRICPGRFIADAQLFITIASILSVFKISPVTKDRFTRPDDLHELFTGGMISHPEPFKCNIEPRGPKALELIRQVNDL
ncbi:cytochrome P450 [Panus rudis PR-1116 ss-1]|nr:cytochrome P450 [Panus rudis PR-1116 ss-1]